MDDEIEEPVQLSPDAEKAMQMAEQKAEERRQKHLQEDQAIAAKAAAGPSARSSGMRVDRSGATIPGAEAQAPPASDPMPESTVPPTPMSLAAPEPLPASAADMLRPAEVQTQAREEAGRAAFALVEQQREARREVSKQQRADLMYYIRCQNCGGPGIWMKTRGAMGPDDWWSSYKPLGVPWPNKVIWCQCCWALRQAQNPLKILHTTVNGRVISVTAYPRMVVEISVSEYARLVGAPSPEPVGVDG